MLYLFRLLLLLININQETVLSWFGVEASDSLKSISEIHSESTVRLETLNLIIRGLWEEIQDGLTLTDIENLLFFILVIRFVILAIRYNLKTSFYITCIGLFAGYLWYRHLIDLISMYRGILIKLPYVQKLGIDAIQLRTTSRENVLTNLQLGENVHWYNPGQLIYFAFIKGMIYTNPETELQYYIDPISMLVSKINTSNQLKILPIYYKLYNKIIPQIFDACSKFWTQLSGIAAYAVIVRIGKRYCPYLVRWHWTFLLIIGFVEQILIYFVYRVSYFQSTILIPQTQNSDSYLNSNLVLQIQFLNGLIAFLVCFHLGVIFFGLFHAIWGQYFYFPFFVENTELHIGSRPKNSIYSGGNTAWQDEKEKKIQHVFPQLWYGWFGRGTSKGSNSFYFFKKIFTRFTQKLKKKFRG